MGNSPVATMNLPVLYSRFYQMLICEDLEWAPFSLNKMQLP